MLKIKKPCCIARLFLQLFSACMNKLSDNYNGIALVAVLAILTVLAILAATFIVTTNIQTKISDTSIDAMKARLLTQSGYQHALSLIQNDVSQDGLSCDSPETDPQIFSSKFTNKWFVVNDRSGNIVGRYKLEISDECGKLNVNTLQSLAEHAILSDKKNKKSVRNDPLFSLLSPKAIKNLRAYQYGPNKLPGLRHVDDNKNNITLENDGLDNNFNGIIDEENEGIDEPAEYNPLNPCGDDKSINSIAELPAILNKNKKLAAKISFNGLDKFLTTYSICHVLPDTKQICINGGNVRQFARALRSTSAKKNMKSTRKELSRLVCNIIDFRDENNSLSTYGGSYGVESICFNEIMANDGSHMLEPHVRNWIPTGNGNKLEEKYCGVVGAILDPYDKRGNEPVARFPMRPTSVKRNGSSVKITYNGPSWIKDSVDFTVNYKKLFNALKSRGKTKGKNILYPINFWKNAHVIFCDNDKHENIEENPRFLPKVLASDARTITIEDKFKNSAGKTISSYELMSQIMSNSSKRVGFWLNNHWERMWGQFTVHPQCTEWAITEIRPRTYFKVYIGNNSFTPVAFKDNSPMLDCDGNPSSYSETKEKLLKWEYKGGVPIRTDAKGMIDVIVTSSKNCNGKRPSHKINKWMDIDSHAEINKTKSVMTHNIFMRPDIVELINVSDKPVSIAGWRVMINTGSVAKELCRINSATHYSKASGGFLVDENPVVPPHGYAYLTSDKQIFSIEYGTSKNNTWGDSAKEQYPCYELPQETWGVWYKIKGFRPANRNLWVPNATPSPDNNIILEGADFTIGEITGEMIEFRSDRKKFKGNNLNGFRRMVTANTHDAVEILYGQAGNAPCDIRVGDYAVLLGMPRLGGFLSLTLRNEYNQITSRTLEYGSTKYTEFDVSTERPDPTVFDFWKKTKKTTFGGSFNDARSLNINKITSRTVIDRPLASLDELLKVSSGNANISFQRNEKKASDLLKTIGPVISMDMIRLDVETEDAWLGEKNAWQSTAASIENCNKSGASVKDKKWKPSVWKNQTLSILSGKLRGEQFKIADNNISSLKIKGRSTQSRKLLSAARGDKVLVGPPYKTPMFYTRKDNKEGKWEWKNTALNPNIKYDLYLFGFNDSIKTTEFLEENHNAQLSVKVWNYKKSKWDAPQKKRFAFDKNDSIYFGKLSTENISDKGAVKISVTPHNLNDLECSGFAWLDYIILTPVEHPGRINVNTAPMRVIAALPYLDENIARNIVKGISKNGKQARPYKNIYDLLNIKGITPDLMCKIANYITTRTDTYRINVTAEILKPNCDRPTSDKIPSSKIISKVRSTYLVERIPESSRKCKFRLLETIDLR